MDSLPNIVLEEIGLEGLDGITIEGLWARLSHRIKLPLPYNEQFCNNIWKYILTQSNIFYYELQEPREKLKIFDRTQFIENVEEISQMETCPFTAYKYNPIDETGIRGSCEHHSTRKVIDKNEFNNLTLQEIIIKWGQKFIMVGSQQLRESTLIPDTIDYPSGMPIICYCLLERIGRSRSTGEIVQGKYSLNDIVRDPNAFFYYKKLLLKAKLIIQQPCKQKVGAVCITSTLFHLPKFYTEMKPKHFAMIEKVVEFLKSKPNYLADYDDIKSHLKLTYPDIGKKYFKQSEFKRFMTTDLKVLYRSCYPDATEKQWQVRNTSKEKTVRAMQLKDPNVNVNEIWFRDDDIEEIEPEYLDVSRQLLNVSLMKQAYRAIDKAKDEGLSQASVRKILGLGKISARTICRNLEKCNVVTTYMKDFGRQRITFYVLMKYKNKTKLQLEEEQNKIIQNIDSNKTKAIKIVSAKDNISNVGIAVDEGNISVTNENLTEPKKEYCHLDINHVEIKIEEIDAVPGYKKQQGLNTSANTQSSKISYRMLKRSNLLLSTIKNEQCVDDTKVLMKAIIDYERKLGYTEKICKKSMMRIISKLSVDKLIKIYMITLKHLERVKSVMFYCDPTVSMDNSKFKTCLEHLKLQFILSNPLDKKDLFNDLLDDEPNQASDDMASCSTAMKTAAETKPLKKSDNCSYLPYPKFAKIRLFHEFLFFLAYEYDVNNFKTIPKEEAIKTWRETNPTIDFDELRDEISDVYSLTIDWKMFIPPMNKYTNYPNGWLHMRDIILRIPLCYFVKFYNILYEVPNLEEFLCHPIRRYYLINQLPKALRIRLTKCRKYVLNIDELSRRLCYIGLLQFGFYNYRQKDQVFIYLNRKASIMNTVSSEPNYYQIEQKEYPITMYNFNTSVDVEQYWKDLMTICLGTKLGVRNKVIGQDVVIEYFHLKPILVKSTENQTPESAALNDNGHIPGDHLGAGGLDSSLFSHIRQNWIHKRRKLLRTLTTKTNQTMRIKSIKQTTPFKRVISSSKSFRSNKLILPPLTRIQVKDAAYRKTSSFVRHIHDRPKKIKRTFYDEIDQKALSLMNKLRVSWSTEEDNILLLCKVGTLYFCPNKHKQLIFCQTYRDILHWICNSINKTSRACQRRLVYMMKNPATTTSVNLCLEEIRQNEEINSRYGPGFVQKLRKIYKTDDELIAALKIHFIDFVVILNKLFYKLSSNSFESRPYILPDSIEDFKKIFQETTGNNELITAVIRYADPESIEDIEMSTIYLLIHSSMCCSGDKSSWNIQLFDIYKNYSEHLLSKTMTTIRGHQLISANKNDNKLHLKKCIPLSSSPFHLSASYQYQMISSISYDIYNDHWELFKEIVNNTWSTKSANKRVELSSCNNGMCFLMAEQLLSNRIQIQIEFPKQILILEPNQDLDPTYERISTRFQELFSYIPKSISTIDNSKMDTEETLLERNPKSDDHEQDQQQDIEKSEKIKQKSVNFSLNGNATFIFNASSLEKIMKFHDYFLHIFCMINNIGAAIPIHNLTINDNNNCPFNCLLITARSCDFWENIATIISEKKDIIAKLKLTTKSTSNSKNDDGATSSSSSSSGPSTKIKEDNLIELFKKLIKEQDDMRHNNDKKDYGKKTVTKPLIFSSIVEVIKEIIPEISQQSVDAKMSKSWITDFYKIDNDLDYLDETIPNLFQLKHGLEISTSYEDIAEKTLRLHDFFVVNSVKLFLNVNWEDSPNVKTIKFNQVDTPKDFMLLDFEKRENILNRIKNNIIWSSKKQDTIEDIEEKLIEIDLDKNLVLDVLQFIENAKEIGSTVDQLLKRFENKAVLTRVLHILNDLNMVLRTGIYTTTYVHWKFVRPWLIKSFHVSRLDKEAIEPTSSRLMLMSDNSTKPRKRKSSQSLEEIEPEISPPKKPPSNIESVDDNIEEPPAKLPKRISRITLQKEDQQEQNMKFCKKEMLLFRPLPWIRVNGSLNKRVLDKWIGTIMTYLYENPGINLLKICTKFNYLHPTHVRYLIDILEEIDCVKISSMVIRKKANLFSCYECIDIAEASEYDPMEITVVEATSDAITKLTLFIGEKKYKKDFI